MKPGILFCTPCYGGKVDAAYFRSCVLLMGDLTLSNVPHDWYITWNESLINRARNNMTVRFLQSEWSHMMWIDADIEFQTDDVVKLWNMDADIAVGFYAMKRPDRPLSAWKNGKLVKIEECPKEPFEVDFAGTGFMMIKRETIEALCERLGPYTGMNGKTWPLYMTPVHNSDLESEDYHFCRIAREAGFKVIGDPSIKLKHWGQCAYE